MSSFHNFLSCMYIHDSYTTCSHFKCATHSYFRSLRLFMPQQSTHFYGFCDILNTVPSSRYRDLSTKFNSGFYVFGSRFGINCRMKMLINCNTNHSDKNDYEHGNKSLPFMLQRIGSTTIGAIVCLFVYLFATTPAIYQCHSAQFMLSNYTIK